MGGLPAIEAFPEQVRIALTTSMLEIGRQLEVRDFGSQARSCATVADADTGENSFGDGGSP